MSLQCAKQLIQWQAAVRLEPKVVTLFGHDDPSLTISAKNRGEIGLDVARGAIAMEVLEKINESIPWTRHTSACCKRRKPRHAVEGRERPGAPCLRRK